MVGSTVNSHHRGHCRDLKLFSLLARVRLSGSVFQSNVCNLYYLGFSCCSYYSGVSARRELIVLRLHLKTFEKILNIHSLKFSFTETQMNG